MKENLARRSIESIGWNAITNVVTIVVSLFRSIILARWLPVEIFGIYAGAGALIGLTIFLTNFGMGAAFLHRAPETEDEEKATRVYFSLKLIFTTIWIIALVVIAAVFTSGLQRTTIVTLALVLGLYGLARISSLILVRKVVHRRIALIQMVDVLLTTGVAVALAWNGRGIWALLATDIISLLVYVMGMYAWRPVWKVRLGWDKAVVRYYINFGRRNFLATALAPAINKIDDMWTAVNLGQLAMGYYSRAYSFATYPRLALAKPIDEVTRGTFAELKADHLRLSKAFFRTNSFLVRSGFIVAGVLVLIAPELIENVLGTKWLPMLTAFRLLLVFTMLSPMMKNISNLFLAMGDPTIIVRVRLIQLIVLLAGLYILGTTYGINGVAITVNIMLLVGIVLFLTSARRYVSFSLRKMFLVPLIALFSGLLIAYGFLTLADVTSDLLLAIIKTVTICAIYAGILFVFERRQTWEMWKSIRNLR